MLSCARSLINTGLFTLSNKVKPACDLCIVRLKYKKPLTEVDKYLHSHRDFLEKYYKQEKFIASGKANPRDGGIIISIGKKEEIEEILQEDPFFKNDIADYDVTEFSPSMYHQEFSNLIDVASRKRCKL